jgi:hypothetical protein
MIDLLGIIGYIPDNTNIKEIIIKILTAKKDAIKKLHEDITSQKEGFEKKINTALETSNKILKDFLNKLSSMNDIDDGTGAGTQKFNNINNLLSEKNKAIADAAAKKILSDTKISDAKKLADDALKKLQINNDKYINSVNDEFNNAKKLFFAASHSLPILKASSLPKRCVSTIAFSIGFRLFKNSAISCKLSSLKTSVSAFVCNV